MKKAILQVADTSPLESLVVMLRSVGYDCYLPNEAIKSELRRIGCDTVLDIDSLIRGMGYAQPFAMPFADMNDMLSADLFVDIKGVRSYQKIVNRWPNLNGRVLWYRIQGGSPEHVMRRNDRGEVVEDCGDEVNPPCPVLTPNQWYKRFHQFSVNEREMVLSSSPKTFDHKDVSPDWAYVCWPPFVRFDDYAQPRQPGVNGQFGQPICLLHNARGWGYQDLLEPMRAMGVRVHGAGSPCGLIQHAQVAERLRSAVCMVHLKSSDAPGYALYEALAAACPVVCTRRLIWRCRMQDLLIPGQTCLVFDRETHEGLTLRDVEECTREVAEHLKRLRDPEENRRFGEAGRKRLQGIVWSVDRAADVESLRAFMERNFA